MVDATPHVRDALLGKVEQRGYLRRDESQLDKNADVDFFFREVMLGLSDFAIEIGQMF